MTRPYRMVAVLDRCPECGAELGATFPVYPGEPEPTVAFRHLPDGTHEPVLSGHGVAARARREGRILGSTSRKLDA